MIINSSSILFIILFTVGGMLLGALVMYLILDAVRDQRDAKNPSHTQPILKPEDPILQKSSNQATAYSEKPEGKPEENEKNEEIVSISMSKEDGTMQVLMDGLWHINTNTMNSAQRQRFENTFLKSAEWLGVQLRNKPSVVAEPPVSANERPSILKSGDLLSAVQPVSKPAPTRKLSIVEQVDEILQEILNDKGLASRNIRLSEMPSKGVIVWVGAQSYEGIEAVPDNEVKDYIRQAVKQWEAQASR